jgi:hypothetical protein
VDVVEKNAGAVFSLRVPRTAPRTTHGQPRSFFSSFGLFSNRILRRAQQRSSLTNSSHNLYSANRNHGHAPQTHHHDHDAASHEPHELVQTQPSCSEFDAYTLLALLFVEVSTQLIK